MYRDGINIWWPPLQSTTPLSLPKTAVGFEVGRPEFESHFSPALGSRDTSATFPLVGVHGCRFRRLQSKAPGHRWPTLAGEGIAPALPVPSPMGALANQEPPSLLLDLKMDLFSFGGFPPIYKAFIPLGRLGFLVWLAGSVFQCHPRT